MPKLKKISGEDCIKILCNKFGFKAVRQRRSHVVLKKGSVGTCVPKHRELKLGTLKSILALAKIEEEEFSRYL